MNRAALQQFLTALQARVATLCPAQTDRIAQKLAAVDWQSHRTDHVWTCDLCGVQDAHAPECPVNLLQGEKSAVSA